MTVVDFTRIFAAAHRVWNDPGKCINIHGHNYTTNVSIRAEVLNESNFVIPFDAIKEIIDEFDHTIILDRADPLAPDIARLGLKVSLVGGVPSTEFLAAHFAHEIIVKLEALSKVAGIKAGYHVTVVLRETASIQATAEAYTS